MTINFTKSFVKKMLKFLLLKIHFFASRNFAVSNYQKLDEDPGFLRLEKPKKMTKVFIKLKKFASFFKKNAKICDIEKLKTIP